MKQERCPPHPRRARPLGPAGPCPVGLGCQRWPLPPVQGTGSEEGGWLPRGRQASTWHPLHTPPPPPQPRETPARGLCPETQLGCPAEGQLCGPLSALPRSLFLLRAVFCLFLKNAAIIFFEVDKEAGCGSEAGPGPAGSVRPGASPGGSGQVRVHVCFPNPGPRHQ